MWGDIHYCKHCRIQLDSDWPSSLCERCEHIKACAAEPKETEE